MHMKSINRLATALAMMTALGIGLPPCANAEAFPPLNTPASQEHHVGKLVWADLFTADPAGASKFYCGLLGWTAATLDQKNKNYTVFSNAGIPVAGLAPRSVKGGNHPSRWIGYLAVENIAATLKAANKNGGKVHAHSQNFPSRGHQAIIADNDGIPIGLLHSDSGDSVDDEPRPGDWNWFELYAKTPKDSSVFYHNVIGFSVAPETNPDRCGENVNFKRRGFTALVEAGMGQ